MTTNQPTPKIYTGPSGGLKKDSQWLASEDIGTREVTVTIEHVEIYNDVAFDGGRKEAKVSALKFAGKEKRMILNATNRKTLVRLYGMDTAQWQGKPVTLYVDMRVRQVGGGYGPGLRIKSEPAKAHTAQEAAQ